jgi:hypothetical protein
MRPSECCLNELQLKCDAPFPQQAELDEKMARQ